MRASLLFTYRNSIQFPRTTHGGVRGLPSGRMQGKRRVAIRAIISHTFRPTWAITICAFRKRELRKQNLRRPTASKPSVTITIGLPVADSSNDRFKKFSLPRNRIFRSSFVGLIKRGPVYGTEHPIGFLSNRRTLVLMIIGGTSSRS